MPKDITGTNQTTLDLTITMPVSGDRTSASRMDTLLQALINNDATLKHLIDSFRLTTSTGISGADAGVGIGAITIGINDGSVGTQQLANNAVTAAKIIANAITSAKILDNAVVTAKIAHDAITAAKIADDAVVTAALDDAAVTTAKVADTAIATGKIAKDAITAAKIAHDAVDLTHLNLTTAGTAEQLLSVGTSYRLTPVNAPTRNTRGLLIATSANITSGGNVGGWTLGTLTSLGSIRSRITSPAGQQIVSGAALLNLPMERPANNVNGLWVVMRNHEPVDVAEILSRGAGSCGRIMRKRRALLRQAVIMRNY